MASDPTKNQFVRNAEAVYSQRLQAELEKHHFGSLIALEPKSGEYVLAVRFRELELKTLQRFGDKPTYMFRIGGGGAVKIGPKRLGTLVPKMM